MKRVYRTNDVLRAIMSKHSMRTKAIASLLSNEYGTVSHRTVEAWVYDKREFSGQLLELLKIKLDTLTQQQPGQG